VGRKRSVILRGGSNVYPQEIEARLHAHPTVQDVVVVEVRDPPLGEAVYASILPMTGTGKVRRVELVRLIEEARHHPLV
jgi:acyl-CoA synthetase (AMP-forming)/AMP-acid ligase II